MAVRLRLVGATATGGRGMTRTTTSTAARGVPLLVVAMGLLAPAPATAAMADAATVRKPTPLAKAGVRVSQARLQGRTLRLRVTSRRKASLDLAVLRRRATVAKGRTVATKGTRTRVVRLNRAPTGSGLRLKVTARYRSGGRKRTAVSIVPLAVGATAGSQETGGPAAPTPGAAPAPAPAPAAPAPPAPAGNRAPTGLRISGTSVAENRPAGTPVGTLAAEDPDGDALTFTLTGGLPGNAAFAIAGSELQTAEPLDFERQSSYAIRVRANDAGGLSIEQDVTITVTDADELPPVAGDDRFDVVGNTGLFVGAARPADQAGRQLAGTLLANDTDPDSPASVLRAEPVTDAATALGGRITIAGDGTFVYLPPSGVTGATDTFTYRVCDVTPCGPSAPTSATGTLELPIAGQVWFVRNDAAPGGPGTSARPFATLAAAESAAGTGDTTFVFRGDGTTTGLDDGFTMAVGERLLGEHVGLELDPDGSGPLPLMSLLPSRAGARPTLTRAIGDIVTLATGAVVAGLELRRGTTGTGGGIRGGAGASAVRVSDVHIVDGRATGDPALRLDGTTGTSTVDDLVVQTAGATGVLINNAGTVDLDRASLHTGTGRGLDASATNLATSTVGVLRVDAATNGGVRLQNTTGAISLTAPAITSIGSGKPALELLGAAGVTLTGGSIAATGGPALNVIGAPAAALAPGTVSSANSTGDGIHLEGLETGTFSAPAGTITGAAGRSFDLHGGSGNVSYGGALQNGAGALAVEVTGRTGGTVALSGAISDTADAGGGVAVSGNSGGATVFSGTSKQLNTGAQPAVVLASSPGHALTFTGGGLDIDTSTGNGLDGSAGGTLAVAGADNTIDTTGGRAISLTGVTVGATGVTFQRVSAAGGANGIVLDGTGSAGRLVVTGNGVTCVDASTCTGGVITGQTGSDSASATPPGTGIVLKDTLQPSLSRMYVAGASNYGIRGTTVSGLTLQGSVVRDNGTNAAAEVREGNVVLLGLTGSAAIATTTIRGGAGDDVRVENASGTLDRLTVSSSTIGPNAAAAEDGLVLRSTGPASVKATISQSTFHGARSDLLNAHLAGSGAGEVVVSASTFANTHADTVTGGGGVALASAGSTATTVFNVTGSSFRGASGHAVLAVKEAGTATQLGTFSNNTIGVAGNTTQGSAEASGLKLQTLGGGIDRWSVSGNAIRGFNEYGVSAQAGGGGSPASGAFDVSLIGNTLGDPGAWAVRFVDLNIGTTAADAFVACADVRGNVVTGGTAPHISARQRFATTVRLPGYTGTTSDVAAVGAYLAGRNGGAAASATYSSAGGGFVNTPSSAPCGG